MAADNKTKIRKELKDRSSDLSLIGLWEIVKGVEMVEPRDQSIAHLWKWTDIEPLLKAASGVVPLEEADRRVLILSNPALYPKHHSTSTLYVSCSIYNPGEVAPVHRHTPNASRFVLEGKGGFTTIEGEKCVMHRGDLIVTPNGTWHDHGNEGDEPVMWVDVLDVPLVESLSATSFEFDYSEPVDGGSNSGELVAREMQTITEPNENSTNLYGIAGLTPEFISHARGESLGTPKFVYRWEETRRALDRLRDYDGSPYDGIILEYTDPVNGGPVTTTMSFHSQLLRPGERTQSHRHTTSTAYCCLDGNGVTRVGDETFEWGRNDMFVVPSWAWHAHENKSASADAILYSVSDSPATRALGLYREEAMSADGSVISIAR